jgi:N6-adenosine-specific RNA methylase IME4
MPATNRKFRAILADPPWHWKAQSAKGTGRGAISHYDVMDLEQIIGLAPDVRAMAADDSVLLLWALNSMLPHALQAFAKA